VARTFGRFVAIGPPFKSRMRCNRHLLARDEVGASISPTRPTARIGMAVNWRVVGRRSGVPSPESPARRGPDSRSKSRFV